MPGWQEALAYLANKVEDRYDDLRYRLVHRLGGGRDPLTVLGYRGCGTEQRLLVRGRVLENEGVRSALGDDSLWDNLLNMYRRFASDEVRYGRLLVRCGETEQEVVTNEEGFFDLWLTLPAPTPVDGLWQHVDVELLSPQRAGQAPARTTIDVLIPPSSAQFGVISDIDDTVLLSDATSLLRMARHVFMGNARTRLPFEGVAEFYRALHAGLTGNERNPLFYVSSGPWNLYDLLDDFFNLQGIPIGPVLFLREWGLTARELLPIYNHEYKLASIRRIMDLYPDLPFILIGDSGQEDPEIYHEVVRLYGKRVSAVYIRNFSRDLKRPEAVRALAAEVIAAGSTLILADNTVPLAEHAIAQGWISPDALARITTEKEKDAAPPGPLETLLGQAGKSQGPSIEINEPTPSATTAAVAEGAVEEALQTGDAAVQEAPTVVVSGDEDKPADAAGSDEVI